MKSELQSLVDSLGARLNRSVAIDDTKLNLLAYSPHVGEVDETRVLSIMHRKIEGASARYALGQGARTARDIFVLPARPDLGMTIERVAMPIRHEDTLLGFMWLMASEGQITDQTRDLLRKAAAAAALVMRLELLSRESERTRERELVRNLLSEDPHPRREAARLLEDEALLAPGHVTVLTINLLLPAGEVPADRDALALSSAVERASRHFPPRELVRLRRSDHAALVISRAESHRHSDLTAVAREVREHVAGESGRPAGSWWIGLGTVRDTVEDAHASYSESRRAAVIARAVDSQDPLANYAQVGVYGLLTQLPGEQLSDSVHSGLRRLLAGGESGELLLGTLEMYLDSAGDVKVTAEKLSVHRTTLYYRLGRIEEIAQVDLNNGNDRLVLHLGLKILGLPGVQ